MVSNIAKEYSAFKTSGTRSPTTEYHISEELSSYSETSVIQLILLSLILADISPILLYMIFFLGPYWGR
jgi:hypothetical protein